MTLQLLCVGNPMVDVYAEITEDFCKRFDLTLPVKHVNAETAARILAAVKCDKTDKVFISAGGGGANTAKIAAGLGVQSVFIGAVGGTKDALDPAGEFFKKEMEKEGVSLFLIQKPFPTGIFFSLHKKTVKPENRQRYIVASPSAAFELLKSDIKDHLFTSQPSSSKILFLDGYLTNKENLFEYLLEMGEKNNLTTALNLGNVFYAREHAKQAIQNKSRFWNTKFRQKPLILFMNKKEALAFAQPFRRPFRQPFRRPFGRLLQKDWKKLFFTQSKTFSIVIIITMGKKGAIIFCGSKMYKIKTQPLNTPECIGAGDAFAAGFLAAWSRNKNSGQCGMAGNRTAQAYLQRTHINGFLLP